MKVTVAQLIKASEKNGFLWARNNHNLSNPDGSALALIMNSDHTCETFSCVVGQGLANLKGNISGTEYHFFGESVESGYSDLDEAFQMVYKFNDNEAKTYQEAVEFMKKTLAPFVDYEINI